MVMDLQEKQENITNLRFSIIIAAYNIENYISRAIESVLNQSFKNYELIVVNDCSTDRTEEEILKYCNKIKYISHSKNLKAGGARNTGLNNANGEYIVFLDGDDYLSSENTLLNLDKFIGNEIIDVIYLGFKIEGDREELVIPDERTCTKRYKASEDIYPNIWSKCWNKQFLDENNIRFPENRFYEDVLFVFNGVMKSNTYKIANFITHNYTSGRKNSMTTKLVVENVYDTLKNLEDLLKIKQYQNTDEIDLVIKKEVLRCKSRIDNVFNI